MLEALKVRNNLTNHLNNIKLFLNEYLNFEDNQNDYSKNILDFILDNKEKK